MQGDSSTRSLARVVLDLDDIRVLDCIAISITTGVFAWALFAYLVAAVVVMA